MTTKSAPCRKSRVNDQRVPPLQNFERNAGCENLCHHLHSRPVRSTSVITSAILSSCNSLRPTGVDVYWCILSLNVVRENTPVHIPIVINPLMTIVYGHTRERTSFSIVRRSKSTSQNLEPDSHTYAHETFRHKIPTFQPIRASCMCALCACAYERHEQIQKGTF